MRIRTLLTLFLLLVFSSPLINCGAPKLGTTASTVAEAEEILAKQAKAKNKIAKKAKKEAYRRYWKMQSKSARKSIKKNKRRQKRKARKQKRS